MYNTNYVNTKFIIEFERYENFYFIPKYPKPLKQNKYILIRSNSFANNEKYIYNIPFPENYYKSLSKNENLLIDGGILFTKTRNKVFIPLNQMITNCDYYNRFTIIKKWVNKLIRKWRKIKYYEPINGIGYKLALKSWNKKL